MEEMVYRLSLAVAFGNLAIVSALIGINIALFRIMAALETAAKLNLHPGPVDYSRTPNSDDARAHYHLNEGTICYCGALKTEPRI